MRFQRLQIPAFGPFTNLEFKFPAKDHDLHVIYGENEAGKSSLLRAIRDLLFGISGHSPDNFLHDYKDLRLKAEIVNLAGDILYFQRRKGNKNTLLDENSNPLPDTALQPFTGSVDLSYFSTMFGLGSAELREGARQLLQGDGEIGHALFSANLGGTPIRNVMDSLIQESERIFKGRATTHVSIRPAVNRFKDLLRQSREATVNPETWVNLEKELSQQGAIKEGLVDEISNLTREIDWISRCEDALPSVARLSEDMQACQALPVLPKLAGDFVERSQSARNAATEAKQKVNVLVNHISQLEEQQSGCPISPEVLSEAEGLENIHKESGTFKTWQDSLENFQNEIAAVEPLLKTGMKNLEITGELELIETQRVSSAVRLQCRETAQALKDALSKRDTADGEVQKLTHEIDSRDENLKSNPETDLTPLREALADAAKATDAHKTLATSEAEVESLTHQIKDQHILVIGAPKDFDDTAGLALPSPATIRKYGQQMEHLNRDIKNEKDNISKEDKNVKANQVELNRLARLGALPSEGTLQEARRHRDQGWDFILAEWKGDGAQDELTPGMPLEEAFPQAIQEADRIADQLRQQAEAVAQAEEKLLQITNSERQITEAQEKRTELQNELKECQESWKAEWTDCGIKARSPEEMEAWRESWVEFRDNLRLLRTAEAEEHVKTNLIEKAKHTISVVIGESPDKDFPVLFEAARSQVQKGEELTGRRNLIEEQLFTFKQQMAKLIHSKADLTKAVHRATEKWKASCKAAALPGDTSPDSGLSLLEERKQLIDKFDEWKEWSAGLDKTAKAVKRYQKDVRKIATSLKIKADTTEGQEQALWEVLTLARKAQAEYDQLVGQIKQANQDLAAAKQEETHSGEALDELLRLAKLDTVDQLEPLLVNLEAHNKVQARIDSLRETLGGLARGQSVDDFIARIQAEDADNLLHQKAQVNSLLEEKETSLQAVQGALSGLKTQKQELEKAGDAAADFRQQAESVAAVLTNDASRFVRLQLAIHFLQAQIERFRKENQGPLLEKSGQVFKHITRGAFDGLSAEFNAQDIPIMVGRRPDGSSVSIEGMSDGSRDQLYLALRLAALDRYLEEHEPMPLILDDLLITFDDERARSILPELADLGTRSQVFLFTHHEHLIELCRQTLGEAQFTLHRLVNTH